MVERLSEILGSSRSSVREALWPILLAVHDRQLGGLPDDFTVVKRLGLSADNHLALHGIPKSHRDAQVIAKAYEEEMKESATEKPVENQENDDSSGTQFSLDSF